MLAAPGALGGAEVLGRELEPLSNPDLAQCPACGVLCDIQRIFREEYGLSTGAEAAGARRVSGRRRRPCAPFGSSGTGGAIPSRGAGAWERRKQRCFSGAARLPEERGAAVPSPGPEAGTPRSGPRRRWSAGVSITARFILPINLPIN